MFHNSGNKNSPAKKDLFGAKKASEELGTSLDETKDDLQKLVKSFDLARKRANKSTLPATDEGKTAPSTPDASPVKHTPGKK
jgi:hypothetical protein